MTQRSLDRTGMWVTAVCALHCLLLPVILPMLSLIGLSFIGEELLERVILGTSIVLGLVALLMGMRQHLRVYPLLLLVAGGFIYWHKDSLGEVGEPAIILLGASLIVLAHWVNLKLTRQASSLRANAFQ
ncbi:MerC domain-containing protein [Pseudidiomarina terrestris]|uniref:MerC domain-containing protein n=2 Tax=Pseudidiomarina terrestris TaxID=2820060 RepID=A0AAW7R232_9GAMM|nr:MULTISPECIES: MerC domain-containing protein [unclassified Pseudidiomarina]MDN7138276.1 MerC domain-containing protein [Pseudidiomarina sp. 1ASP75-14]MDN7125751.1 MerC domain-containing protein [Pseudidiomarina sp. 1APP75-32.1]MDN7128182.1 MerC domain-containing protein [Pseudidiomarina sp. 1APR75-33.1]MDN7129464.1 MerC domain-containing protein [Pseudidiomarina sp. 1APR75-15]MDN7135780.1 MerC domain-containing protein [Pseudidiomarina sp. 1ASP75-5]